VAVNSNSLDLELSSSQYSSITDVSQTGLDITGDMTIMAWVKPESLSANHMVVSKRETTGNQRSYRFFVDSTGLVNFIGSSDGINQDITGSGSTTISTGVWNHIAIVYDNAGTLAFYLNTVADGTVTGLPTSIFNGTAPFAIGADFAAGVAADLFDGLVDEVRIFNRVLTAGDIVSFWKNDIGDANLQGYWQLNNDYLDVTTNNNDLTATGSPVFSTDVPFATYGAVGGIVFPASFGGPFVEF